jgi:hypothetical protein
MGTTSNKTHEKLIKILGYLAAMCIGAGVMTAVLVYLQIRAHKA